MILGLTGAHRTGKTTLAKAYAEKYGIEFVPSSASNLFAKLGLEPSDKLSIADRMMVQEAILDDMETKLKSIRKREVGAIFDRTPFDLIAYTLCDVSNGSIESEEMEECVLKYIQRCYDVANKYFNVGVLVQPGREDAADVADDDEHGEEAGGQGGVQRGKPVLPEQLGSLLQTQVLDVV